MITYRAGMLLTKMPKANCTKLIRVIFARYVVPNLQVAHFSTRQRHPCSSCLLHHHPPSCSRARLRSAIRRNSGRVLNMPTLSWQVRQGLFPAAEEPGSCSAGASGGLIREDLWGGWTSSASGVESQMQLSECKGTTIGLISTLEMDLLKRHRHFSVWGGEGTGRPRWPPGTQWGHSH